MESSSAYMLCSLTSSTIYYFFSFEVSLISAKYDYNVKLPVVFCEESSVMVPNVDNSELILVELELNF